jgi:hypothetical protein
MTEQASSGSATKDHLTWVRTRMTLERDFRETSTWGFALITAGFGSFAIFDGLTFLDRRSDLPLAFALGATAVGVVVILLAMLHYQKMTAWVDTDEFGSLPVPKLPNERRSIWLAAAAMAIGLISFVALLLLFLLP